MRRGSAHIPLMLILVAIAAVAMFIPAIYAATWKDWTVARAFLYSGLLLLGVLGLIAMAMIGRPPPQRPARSNLLTLLGAYTVLPLCLALPMSEGMASVSFFDAYFEMVSCFTTTGATILERPETVPRAIHLWRALVGWMGGFFVWVTAVAVLAPMHLGGFEVIRRSKAEGPGDFSQITRTASANARVRFYALRLLPIYVGTTFLLWTGLYILGDSPLVAVSHAMSTLATSGISPSGGLTGTGSGIPGEVLVALFLCMAMTRQIVSRDWWDRGLGGILRHDPELRLGLALVLALAGLIFARHWVGALEEDGPDSVLDGLKSLWGGVFTVLSFLTTTGFESVNWSLAQRWSGLETPGVIFVGLVLIGGGVATTAGGVKLLRVFVLFRHGQRELERLIHPSSVAGVQNEHRFLRRQGSFIAWIFFMLFGLSIAFVMLALSLTGVEFEAALLYAVSALSTTGPLVDIGLYGDMGYATLTTWPKVILAASMVLGRLEMMAIIALLNPQFWRG